MAGKARPTLPEALGWLSDAPLFIDPDQVGRFYDAVARPRTKEGTTTLEITDEVVTGLSGKLGLGAEITTEKLAGLLGHLLAFALPEIKASGTAEAGRERKATQGKSVSYQLAAVETPQSQLETLILFYLAKYPERIVLPEGKNSQWRDARFIRSVPRSLVFLDLPGQEDAEAKGGLTTKIIPTVAEFEKGAIDYMYPKLRAKNGKRPPSYPEEAGTAQELREKRKEYWSWFAKHFSARTAMEVVEDAASENGRIRWIDYRLPLSAEGDTLHLHVCPEGNYDTGVLAYNFIKRGHKHGVRLIGTLKSEPDMNVLAIYEK